MLVPEPELPLELLVPKPPELLVLISKPELLVPSPPASGVVNVFVLLVPSPVLGELVAVLVDPPVVLPESVLVPVAPAPLLDELLLLVLEPAPPDESGLWLGLLVLYKLPLLVLAPPPTPPLSWFNPEEPFVAEPLLEESEVPNPPELLFVLYRLPLLVLDDVPKPPWLELMSELELLELLLVPIPRLVPP